MSNKNGNGTVDMEVPGLDMGAPPMKTSKRSKVATEKVERVTIPAPDFRLLKIRIKGDSPLIVHKFSEKCMKQMEDNTQKKARGPKEARDPQMEFESARYILPNGKDGFPASGIKLAMVSACRFTDGIKMTLAKGAFFVMGDYVEIKGNLRRREDVVRIGSFGNKVAMVRYRPCFDDWSMEFTIRYNAGVFQAEQIINLLTIAGFSVGLGEWRPEKNGSMGMFSTVS